MLPVLRVVVVVVTVSPPSSCKVSVAPTVKTSGTVRLKPFKSKVPPEIVKSCPEPSKPVVKFAMSVAVPDALLMVKVPSGKSPVTLIFCVPVPSKVMAAVPSMPPSAEVRLPPTVKVPVLTFEAEVKVRLPLMSIVPVTVIENPPLSNSTSLKAIVPEFTLVLCVPASLLKLTVLLPAETAPAVHVQLR